MPYNFLHLFSEVGQLDTCMSALSRILFDSRGQYIAQLKAFLSRKIHDSVWLLKAVSWATGSVGNKGNVLYFVLGADFYRQIHTFVVVQGSRQCWPLTWLKVERSVCVSCQTDMMHLLAVLCLGFNCFTVVSEGNAQVVNVFTEFPKNLSNVCSLWKMR